VRDPHLRPPRWWAVAVAGRPTPPLVLWAVGPDRAPSLTKDMDQVFAAAIVVTAATFIVAFHVVARRALGRMSGPEHGDVTDQSVT